MVFDFDRLELNGLPISARFSSFEALKLPGTRREDRYVLHLLNGSIGIYAGNKRGQRQVTFYFDSDPSDLPYTFRRKDETFSLSNQTTVVEVTNRFGAPYWVYDPDWEPRFFYEFPEYEVIFQFEQRDAREPDMNVSLRIGADSVSASLPVRLNYVTIGSYHIMATDTYRECEYGCTNAWPPPCWSSLPSTNQPGARTVSESRVTHEK